MRITPVLVKLMHYFSKFRPGFIIFFILLFSLTISGQPHQINFQKLKQGASNQFIRCILKDSRGIVWFGTNNGLTKYDGLNFIVYEYSPKDTNSLNYNSINAIIEDKNKNIWIGTSKGLNLYNRESDNFIHVVGIQSFFISVLCEDKTDNIWIGTIGSGILRYNLLDHKVQHYTHHDSEENAVLSNHITGIVVDNKNRLWVGSWNGLDLLDIKGNTIKHLEKQNNEPTSLSDNYVNALFIENNRALWVGTLYGGLNKLTFADNYFKFEHFLVENNNAVCSSILSLFADKNNTLWIGTENKGLFRLHTNSGKYEQFLREEGNPNSLSSNTIRSIYVDDLNILWIGTMRRGVIVMDERNNRFEIYRKNLNSKNSFKGEEVRSFTEDKQGIIWIACYDGIYTFDIKKQQFKLVLSHEKGGLTTNTVNSINFDVDENLWIGTFGGGIDRFNKNLVKTGNFKITGNQKAGDNKINKVFIDRKNNVWAGSVGSGLFRFDKSKNVFVQIFDVSKGVSPNALGYVNTILEDSNDNLWVGTAYKLYCLKDIGNGKYSYEIFGISNTPGSITSNYITAILEDHNKNLWFGSMDQGLFLYNNKKKAFISYQKQDGLPSNSISGILEDNHGNLWISTNKGITKFNVSGKKIRNYTTEDGLITNEFDGINCCLKAKNGQFFFGLNEGFSVFFPEKIKDNVITRPIILTDFKIFNQSVHIGKGSPLRRSISETKSIVLNHDQSSVAIEFVTLNYIQGSENKYAYILEGLENKWNIINHSNFASYTYLKPGKYLFKVKGSNNDGIWNTTPTELEIIILPPFWQTKWAYSFYLLIFIGTVVAFIQYRVARAKQIHLAELNQMKLQFFANISHELRTPLSLIIAPIESILGFAKDNKEVTTQLNLIYKNANRLFRLVNEIMDFSKAVENKLTLLVHREDIVKFIQELSFFYSDEAKRRGITYSFETDTPSIEAWFDCDKFEKIILNLLSNAFKFTADNGKILLKIEKINDVTSMNQQEIDRSNGSLAESLRISVIDNGRGISFSEIDKVFNRFYQGSNTDFTGQTGSGIGLSLTRTLIELHHGKITVTSEERKETCFSIVMPLGNDHFNKNEIIAGPIAINSQITEKNILFSQEDIIDKANTLVNASTILIVEDNFDLRKYIVSALSKSYKVLEAEDGEIGYKIACENIPDLIISDIIMPNLSGIDFCKQIKENIITSHIPFILLTAKVTIEDKITGIETGADAYITKPFNVRYLGAITKNLIETRKKIFKRFSQDVYMLPKEMSKNPLDQYFLEKIINYVEQNILNTGLIVEDLASHLLMSQGHTWRKVKALTGMTTNEFIRTIRLKNAIKLMEEEELNISEIAYRVGFSSPAYFTKCFKDQYGKSPSSFSVDKNKK